QLVLRTQCTARFVLRASRARDLCSAVPSPRDLCPTRLCAILLRQLCAPRNCALRSCFPCDLCLRHLFPGHCLLGAYRRRGQGRGTSGGGEVGGRRRASFLRAATADRPTSANTKRPNANAFWPDLAHTKELEGVERRRPLR